MKRKKNIEWSQLSYNWMSGCDGPGGIHCKGCYAKNIARRLRGRFGYPKQDYFKAVPHLDKMDLPTRRKKSTVYFSVSMGDWMFAEPVWRMEALEIMRACKHHIFVTLTKQYDDLWKITADSPLAPAGVHVVNKQLAIALSNMIPKNVIIGISVTNRNQVQGIDALREVPAFTRMVCFEPLLEDVSDLVDLEGIGWIIIGKRTRQGRTPEFMPEKEWVDKLIAKAWERNIPVFLKPSMTDPAGWEQIQETPYARIREAMRVKTLQEYQDHMDGAIKKAMIPPGVKYWTPPPPRGRMCGSDGIY